MEPFRDDDEDDALLQALEQMEVRERTQIGNGKRSKENRNPSERDYGKDCFHSICGQNSTSPTSGISIPKLEREQISREDHRNVKNNAAYRVGRGYLQKCSTTPLQNALIQQFFTRKLVQVYNMFSAFDKQISRKKFCAFACTTTMKKELMVHIVCGIEEANRLEINFVPCQRPPAGSHSKSSDKRGWNDCPLSILQHILYFLFGEDIPIISHGQHLQQWMKLLKVCQRWSCKVATIFKDSIKRSFLNRIFNEPNLLKICYSTRSELEPLMSILVKNVHNVWDVETLDFLSSRPGGTAGLKNVNSYWLESTLRKPVTKSEILDGMHFSEALTSVFTSVNESSCDKRRIETGIQWLKAGCNKCSYCFGTIDVTLSRHRHDNYSLKDLVLWCLSNSHHDMMLQEMSCGSSRHSSTCFNSFEAAKCIVTESTSAKISLLPSMMKAICSMLCIPPLVNDLAQRGRLAYYENYESSVHTAISKMCQRGIAVDFVKLVKLYALSREILQSLERKLRRSCSTNINVNSPKSIADTIASKVNSQDLPADLKSLLEDYISTGNIQAAQKLSSNQQLERLEWTEMRKTAILIKEYRYVFSWYHKIQGIFTAVRRSNGIPVIKSQLSVRTATGRIQGCNPPLQNFPQSISLPFGERRCCIYESHSKGDLALSTELETKSGLLTLATDTSEGQTHVLVDVYRSSNCGSTEENQHSCHVNADRLFLVGDLVTPSSDNLDEDSGDLIDRYPYLPAVNRIVTNPRKLFVARNGFAFLSADFRQIELRIIAHFSGDSTLINLMQNKECDAFTDTAASWFRKSRDSISSSERGLVKSLVYGICYGMGIKQMAESIETSFDEAKRLYYSFHRTFPGIQRFIDSCIKQCKQSGGCRTLLGNRREFPSINSKNYNECQKAKRQAVNFVCQGSAADILKKIILTFTEASSMEFQGHILLPIHDELLFEVPKHDVKRHADYIRQCMEHSVELKVPLPVKLSVGSTWGDLHEDPSL